jgi:hypothetical protein
MKFGMHLPQSTVAALSLLARSRTSNVDGPAGGTQGASVCLGR